MALSYPHDLLYTDTHEYIRLEGDIATIGITEFAVHELGDIVFLELPEVRATFEKQDPFGTVESVKAVETLFAPISFTVIERNEELIDNPENLANEPYRDGWMLKIQINDPTQLENLLSAAQYSSLVEGK